MCGWVQDWVPDYGNEKAAIKLHVHGGFSDLNGFHSSLLEPFSSSSNCGAIPVDAVVCLQNINCNAIYGVSLSHCLSVLTQSDFQCLLILTYIHSGQSQQGTSNTTPVCFCSGCPALHCFRSLSESSLSEDRLQSYEGTELLSLLT